VIDAFFAAGVQDTAIGRLRVQPSGLVTPARFSTYRLAGGRRVPS
jgi:hypothetical protein